jgi:hypothetical protein
VRSSTSYAFLKDILGVTCLKAGLLIDGLLKASFFLGVTCFDGVAFFLFGVDFAASSSLSKSKSPSQSSNDTPAFLAFAAAATKGSTIVIPLNLTGFLL